MGDGVRACVRAHAESKVHWHFAPGARQLQQKDESEAEAAAHSSRGVGGRTTTPNNEASSATNVGVRSREQQHCRAHAEAGASLERQRC